MERSWTSLGIVLHLERSWLRHLLRRCLVKANTLLREVPSPIQHRRHSFERCLLLFSIGGADDKSGATAIEGSFGVASHRGFLALSGGLFCSPEGVALRRFRAKHGIGKCTSGCGKVCRCCPIHGVLQLVVMTTRGDPIELCTCTAHCSTSSLDLSLCLFFLSYSQTSTDESLICSIFVQTLSIKILLHSV